MLIVVCTVILLGFTQKTASNTGVLEIYFHSSTWSGNITVTGDVAERGYILEEALQLFYAIQPDYKRLAEPTKTFADLICNVNTDYVMTITHIVERLRYLGNIPLVLRLARRPPVVLDKFMEPIVFRQTSPRRIVS